MQTQLDLPFRLSPAPPRDERHVHLGAHLVGYKLVRSRRRTLGLTIDHRGLRVGAPRGVSLAEIETFIRSNADWVLRKLADWRAGPRGEALAVREGARVPVLGKEVVLRVATGSNRVRWRDDEVVLEARATASLRGLLERALRQRAFEVFDERVALYAGRFGRVPPPLRLSNAQTRWGSCSHKSGVRLNWRLVHFPLRVIDYVVAHELAHLVEMNHSARFWQVVEQIYPGYREPQAELKRLAAQMPQL
jgi:hypothetical protein